MTYKVEKGVSIPRRPNKYPFRDMKVGDSFAFPIAEYNLVSGSASSQMRRYGTQWAVRKYPDGTARIWRVKKKETAT